MIKNSSFAALLITLGLELGAFAQAPVVITTAVNNNQLVTLAGNTRPEATTQNDLGPVPDATPIEHMLLQLHRSAQQEQALDQLIDQMHKPGSPNFHQWLTAAQFGQRFGLAQQDLKTITTWLTVQGFSVNLVYPNGLLIDFSGNAGQVRTTFHTQIHNLNVKGVKHMANMTDPQIPAALAPAVSGIVSLHNFLPQPMNVAKGNFTFVTPEGPEYVVVPADIATIYNFKPLFNKGTTGQGQKIVVIEDSNLYSTADWTAFRAKFGLAHYTSGSLSQTHPGPSNCVDPGVNGDDGEVAIDVEYASAAAPSAAIEVASCSDTNVTFGGLIALHNLINARTQPPSIVSISYGECEAYLGAAGNSAYNAAYQQAVAEGVSVYVASGDWASVACDHDEPYSIHGVGVSGFASTPYNVAAGGTDFADTALGQNANYWSGSNTPASGSALSYIPEIPWNDSCASNVLALYITGSPVSYGENGFCNSYIGSFFLDTTGGSGGPSGCASGHPISAGVVDGTCKGYAKPSWQANVPGIPNDGVRGIPDVSLFAANNLWSHYFVFCFSDPYNGGAPCTGSPAYWPGAGGTSFSSPMLAGIQALVNETVGELKGTPIMFCIR